MGDFQKLHVWELSKNLAIEIYRVIEDSEKLRRDFGLKDQLQRSAVSISSNIAEGDELRTVKNGIRHLYIAKGFLQDFLN